MPDMFLVCLFVGPCLIIVGLGIFKDKYLQLTLFEDEYATYEGIYAQAIGIGFMASGIICNLPFVLILMSLSAYYDMKAVSTLFVSIAIAILFFWTLLICALNAGANAIRNIGQNELDEDGSERKRKAKVDEPDEF